MLTRPSAILAAVPAFMRVEPATSSGPVSSTTLMSAATRAAGFEVTRAVRAPRRRASASAARTNGVVPEALIPTTRSRAATRARRTAAAPADRSSSAPSTARVSARAPPARSARTRRGATPKVGGHSAASRAPSLPLVPAPA